MPPISNCYFNIFPAFTFKLSFSGLNSRCHKKTFTQFYRACFCVLNLCDVLSDHGEAADKFEDWLWIKLRQCIMTESTFMDQRHGENNNQQMNKNMSQIDARTKLPLERLQKQIFLDYGKFCWKYIYIIFSLASCRLGHI